MANQPQKESSEESLIATISFDAIKLKQIFELQNEATNNNGRSMPH